MEKNKKMHISSSFNCQKGFGRHFENRLGDYRVIITSTATNQRGEFSIITHVIILKQINKSNLTNHLVGFVMFTCAKILKLYINTENVLYLLKVT